MIRSHRSGGGLRSRTALALALAISALAACGGGGHGTPSAPFGPGLPQAPGFQGFVYPAAALAHAQVLGPAHLRGLGIDVALAMRDAPGLFAYAQAVADPSSPEFRQFLSPSQIAERFAASAADQAKAIGYFNAYGLRVGAWQQRMMLHVAGTQAQLEAAFRTHFGLYRASDGSELIGPLVPPSVAPGIAVVGSPDIVLRPKRFVTQFVPALGIEAGYAPQQLAAAFDYDGAYAAGFTGAGITIGIVGTGPISLSVGGKLGDVDAFKGLFHVAGASAVSLVSAGSSDPVVNGNAGFASPPPVTGPCTTSGLPGVPPSYAPTASCNPEDLETQLDTEQAASLAPSAQVQYYLAYDPNDGCGGPNGSTCAPGTGVAFQGLAESDEELQTVIDRDTADVVSLSFGGPEFTRVGAQSPPAEFTADGGGLDPAEFAAMAAEGISVFASSGDAGAEGCQPFAVDVNSLCVEYPASDPNVSAVGGVTTPLDAAGRIVGPITVWGGQTTQGLEGTGGGLSAYFPLPPYQTGAAGVLGGTRNVPDLSLNADSRTGVAVLLDADPSLGGAALVPVGGTSAAAPALAAMWARAVQACRLSAPCTARGSGPYPYRLGPPNPFFYGLYENAPSTFASAFLPVLYGNNALASYCYYNAQDTANCPTPAPGATATPLPSPIPTDPGYGPSPNGGYNQATGLGVPFARALAAAAVQFYSGTLHASTLRER